MSRPEYWGIAIPEMLAECGIAATDEQATELAHMVDGCADCASDYDPPVGYAGTSVATELADARERIKRLTEVIDRLAVRYGIGIDVERMTVSRPVRTGSGHWSTDEEKLR